MPETEGSRRRAALPSLATERRGSGGRACLRYRHSTHAQKSASLRSASGTSERERAVAPPARRGRPYTRLQRDEMRQGIGRAGNAAEFPTCCSWQSCKTRGAPRRRWVEGERCGERAGRGRRDGGHSLRSLLRASPTEFCPKTDRFHLGMRYVMSNAVCNFREKKQKK